MSTDAATALIEVGVIVTLALVGRVLVRSRLPLEAVPTLLRHRVELTDRWAPALLVVVSVATCLGLALRVVL